MLTVGLTGNAGSGKTTVADAWREQGVDVIDADRIGHEVLEDDRDVRRALAIEFGEHVLEPSANADAGPVRRGELARRAFASPEATAALNRIVHPPLRRRVQRRLHDARVRGTRLVVVDAALIFELRMEDEFDRIVLVTAPADLRRRRLRDRGVDEALLDGLFASQIPDAGKTSRSHFVLRNDDTPDALRSAARVVLDRLRAEVAVDAASAPAERPA